MGTHPNAIGDAQEREWGQTRTRLGIDSQNNGDRLSRRWKQTMLVLNQR